MEGSDLAYGFGYCGEGPRLYVFEAAIDLLSFLTLYPLEWQKQSYNLSGRIIQTRNASDAAQSPMVTGSHSLYGP